jgi:hypothetical protein
MRRALTALIFVTAALVTTGAWGQVVDHEGEDVTIVEDTSWTGEHRNIRTLRIDERAILSVTAGSPLTIRAETIEVFGHLRGDRSGAGGGTAGGRGRGGAAGGGAGAGTNGANGAVCGRPGVDYNAGGGGAGAGSYFGRGGNGGAGADANDGGCQGATGGTGGGVTSDTQEFRQGAGAGGGGGAGGRRHVAGTAGQRGGGMLIVDTKSLRVEGSITVDGGVGGSGGTSPDFYHGGGGGGGAAGGSVQITTTYLLGGGLISSRGGAGGNGGQGDQIGNDSFQGAGGGGGGGGLAVIEYANRNAWQGACNVQGGAPGAGSNTNGAAGAPGGAGRCVERQVNGRPTAMPGGPYITVEGRPIRVDGSDSVDPDGDNLTYEWDCNDDGQFESLGALVDCTFGNNGTYDIHLRVSDNSVSDTATTQVVVTEGPPLAVVAGPERINEGDTLNLDASGSTGFSDTIDDYAWDLDYDGEFQADQSGPTATLSVDFCDNGVFTVAVRITDSGGSTALALHRVIVTNVAPSVSSVAPAVATEGLHYEYQIDVVDPGCDDTTYTLIAAPDGLSVNPDGLISFQPTFRQALAGDSTVRVLISDDDFGRVTHEWTITVAFADGDEDGLPDTWELFYGLDPASPFDALDDNDGDGRDNRTEFQNDTDPTSFDGPTPPRLSTPRDGSEVSNTHPSLRSFRSVSPLGDALRYEFQLYSYVDDPMELTPELLIVNEENVEPVDNSATVDWTVPDQVTVDDHTSYCWRVRARDSVVFGEWSEMWCWFVNLGNEPPTAPTVISPTDDNQIDNGMPELIVGNCTDADQDPLSYTFVLYAGEGITTPVASVSALEPGEDGMTSWAITEDLTENQKYCWRAQCRDNEGQTSPYTEFACFVVNRANDLPPAPVILAPIAEAEEDRAIVEETPVQIVIRNSVDPEGDSLVYEFQLDTTISFDSPDLVSEDIGQDIGSETAWIPTHDWQDNTVYFARVRATDGQGTSPYAVTEFFLNFENDPPTAPEIRAPANNTIIGSRQPTLTVVNAQDPDGDVLKYTFEVFSDPELMVPIDKRSNVAEGPETTQYKVSATQLLDGSFYWRVQAADAEASGPWSEVGVFIVQGSASNNGTGNNGQVNPNNDSGDPNVTPPSDEGCGCVQLPAAPTSGGGLLLVLGAAVYIWRRRR